jgi:DNA gyrase/topoisomerase IV subunit A
MKLEKRIVELESELEKEKENMKKLEKKLEKEIKKSSKREDEISALREQNKNLQNSAPPPPPPARSSSIGSPQSTKSNFSEREIDNEEFLQQKERIMRLEKELEIERNSRKEADGEVIRLRAAINGVNLDESMIQSLIPAGDDLSKPSAEEQTTESQITFESEARYVLFVGRLVYFLSKFVCMEVMRIPIAGTPDTILIISS